MNVTPQQTAVYLVVQAFVAASLGIDLSLVVQGLANRAAIPAAAPGFVVMELTRNGRLRTNVVTWDLTDPAPDALQIEQGTKLTMQLDFYGALAGDWAVIMSTLLRDETGCTALAPTCQPLFTSEPQLAPLEDDEEQYELHYMMEAYLQYNPVVTPPMEFADTLEVTLINVDQAYPP